MLEDTTQCRFRRVTPSTQKDSGRAGGCLAVPLQSGFRTADNKNMNREKVLATLRAHERELKKSGIVRLSLFGSVARDNAGPDSDIDLLAAFDESRRLSLLDVVGIELQLADLLGGSVDLSEEGSLKPRVRQNVEAEAVRAF